jgi:hypothetical protein
MTGSVTASVTVSDSVIGDRFGAPVRGPVPRPSSACPTEPVMAEIGFGTSDRILVGLARVEVSAYLRGDLFDARLLRDQRGPVTLPPPEGGEDVAFRVIAGDQHTEPDAVTEPGTAHARGPAVCRTPS